jgi:hypothetical protein
MENLEDVFLFHPGEGLDLLPQFGCTIKNDSI